LLALATERNFSEIDVTDIAREAGLNRTTFYLHYEDKESLIAELLTSLLDEISEGGRTLRASEAPLEARFDPDWHDTLFRRIGERPALFRRLFAQIGPGSFNDRLLAQHEEGISLLWDRLGYPDPPAGPPRRVRARFAASGIQGLIRQWLDSGQKESADTLADWVWALTFPDHDQVSMRRNLGPDTVKP
jgi:AcrR family transcriptional regulator